MSPAPAAPPTAIPVEPPLTPRVGPGGRRAAADRGEVRAEIQALRAIAVALVVGYHVWPAAVPAGFVGVDVFFAISGFLITTMLVRELERTGRISLTAFWARRARRLLPAAFVVLLACAGATAGVVPLTYWSQYFADVRASALYFQNWHLAATAVDYFASGNDPSPLQHFWSLSVEEQFYVAWPLILFGAVVVARRAGARDARLAIAAGLGVLTAGSLAYGLHETGADPVRAYFATPTRAWEFGVGGLLALLPCGSPSAIRPLLSWIGLSAIALAAVFYSDTTAFPGTAALLPVVGALAVIRAGAPKARWAPTPLLGLPPVRFLGDVSYSVYLWHWPLIVLAPFAIGHELRAGERCAVVLASVAAAWGTKLLVEDPVRHRRFLVRRRGRWTLAFAAAGAAIVVAVATVGAAQVQRQVVRDERAAVQVLAAPPACFGAAARDPVRPCRPQRLRLPVVPTPVAAARAGPPPCTLYDELVCAFGVPASRAAETVALVGDSHAGHWRSALEPIARAKRWQGVTLSRVGCALSAANRAFPEPRFSGCSRWKRQVLRWFARHPEVHTVFVSQIAGGRPVVTRRRDHFAVAVEGYTAAWAALPASVTRIIVIRDTPRVHGDTDDCVQTAMERHVAPGPRCAVRRHAALPRDPAVAAARRLASRRVRTIDLTRYFCGPTRCWPVIGGVLVFRDESHLTPAFGRTLSPYLRRAVEELPQAAAPPSPARGSAIVPRRRRGCHALDRIGTIDMRGAGRVGVRVGDGRLRVSRIRPNPGWRAAVRRNGGRARVTFRRGAERVDLAGALQGNVPAITVCRS